MLIFDKDFRVNHLDQRHLYLPITDINICVNFDFQGVCDERPDLGVHDIVNLNIKEEPRANHFSFWFGFGGSEAVMLDVTQPGYDFSPWIAKKYNSKNHTCLDAVVRLSSQTIPTDVDIGCVLRELDVAQGVTVAHIVDLLRQEGRQRYMFTSRHMQKLGCRHWIHAVSWDLEREGIAGQGFGDDVLSCLQIFYARYGIVGPDGRWIHSGNWTARPEFPYTPVEQGTWY